MMQGARDVLGHHIRGGLVITRYGYLPEALRADPGLTLIEAGHPVPDANSLRAGALLVDFLEHTATDAPVLFLISGGASALVEVLPEEVDLATWQNVNQWLLGSGLDISAINAVRRSLSLIKGGRLASHLHDLPACALYISDVPDDNPALIGSGLLAVPGDVVSVETLTLPDWLRRLLTRTGQNIPMPETTAIEHAIVADAAHARQAAAKAAVSRGVEVRIHDDLLMAEINLVVPRLTTVLADGRTGMDIWSGEVTLHLPDNPGRGGRCQSLALAMARELAGQSCQAAGACFLAAGTDGSDGNSEQAGACVDTGSWQRMLTGGVDPDACFNSADAYTALKVSGDLLATGPTGSNVMDLIMLMRAV